MDEKKIEGYKKSVKNAGNFAVFMGWLQFLLVPGLFLWSLTGGMGKTIFDELLASKGVGFFIYPILVGMVFVLLGNRIKLLKDKNTVLYLGVLSILTLVSLINVNSSTSGLMLVLFIILLLGWFSFNKLLKVEEFRQSLTTPEYKFKKTHWIILIILGVIFIVSL